MRKVDRGISIEKRKGKFILMERSLYSGRNLKILYTFDDNDNYHDREIFFNAYKEKYYNE